MLPRWRQLTAAALLMSAVSVLCGQIQPHAPLGGEMLPVVACHDSYLEVLQDGRKKRTWDMAYEVRPAAAFADGRVEITEVHSDLEPLRDASVKERTSPHAIRFRYAAKVTADRPMSDCYALLTFTTAGSVGTHLIQLGKLSGNAPKPVKIETRNQVDSVGTLHVFSGGLEVRSNQHPDAYDAKAYLAELTRDTQGLPAAELLKYEDVYPHVLSRDGRLLATVRKRDGKQVLIVYDLESMKLLHQLAVADADDRVNNPTWVSDHELVYVTVVEKIDAAGSFRYGWSVKSLLHRLDVTSGKTAVLLDDVDHIITSVHDRPHVLVVGGWSPQTGSWWMNYDVRTRKSSRLEDPDAGHYLFDRNGVARVLYKVRGHTFSHWFRPTPTARWQRLDEAVRQPGLRFDLPANAIVDRLVDIHSVGPDGDTLYVSTRLESDRFELAAFSLSEGVIKQTIARHPKYDLTTGDFGRTRLLFARDTPQLIGMVFDAQKPQVSWLDPHFAAVQARIDGSLPDTFNLPIDWDVGATTFIYLSSSDQDAGTFYVFRPLESKLIPVLKVAERLEGKTLAKTAPLEFVARDGVKIPAYVTRPPELTGPAPLVVIVHGGPTMRDSWGFDPDAQFLASRGYIVLRVNYRGSSGYGAAFQKAGLQARLDTVVIDDIADGVRHLIKAGEVDPSRVGIMGASFGGWATYLSLIKYPELYRAGVAIKAIASWRKTMSDERWWFSNKVAYNFLKSLLERESFAADEKFIDPYLRAAELKQPIYIMHGSRDGVVNSAQADLMLNALRKTNPQVHTRVFPRAGHGNWSYDDRVVQLNEVAAFFERYLRSDVPPIVVDAR